MAENTITGRAKKYDGTAIDYVSIFDWLDGKCITQVTPDESGVWAYRYTTSRKVGLTYVADGCEPITHGPYEYLYQSTIPQDYILAYDFNGTYLDRSTNGLDAIKAGNVGFVTGRKSGTQALEFISGRVQTPQMLPINSKILAVSFWLRTQSTADAMIYETSQNSISGNNATILGINDPNVGTINSVTKGTGLLHISRSPLAINDTWQHCIVVMDRTKSTTEMNKIYINNVLTSTNAQMPTGLTDNFSNEVMYIGQRTNGTKTLQGVIQDFKVYNRALTDDERLALFNE